VAIASPAPFTQQPTVPLSLMNESPWSRACRSDGASAETSAQRTDLRTTDELVVVHDQLGVEGQDAAIRVVTRGLISASDAPTA